MLAYVDSFVGGLVPCKIVGEDAPSGDRRWFKVKITANRRGYAKNLTYKMPASAIVPRDAVHKSRQRPGHFVVWAHDWNQILPRG
jgi:hypothetical protein